MEYDIEKIDALPVFDPIDYLKTPAAKEAYLVEIRSTGSPEEIAQAEKLVAEK